MINNQGIKVKSKKKVNLTNASASNNAFEIATTSKELVKELIENGKFESNQGIDVDAEDDVEAQGVKADNNPFHIREIIKEKQKSKVVNETNENNDLSISHLRIKQDLVLAATNQINNYLGAKENFLTAREDTINELKHCLVELEKKFSKHEIIGEIGGVLGNAGGSIPSIVTLGIPKIVGEAIKASARLSKAKIAKKANEEFHLSLEGEENELIQLNETHSSLSNLLEKNQELASASNSSEKVFNNKYLIYDLLIKDGIWKERKLTPEKMELAIISLSENLDCLKSELDGERKQFEKLTQIRKGNEQEIVNQVKIIDQDQRIKDLETQINDKEKALKELVDSVKDKLKSKHFLPAEREKRTQERHKLLEGFLETGSTNKKLKSEAEKSQVDLQEIINLKGVIKNFQDQLNFLQLENQVIQLDLNK